MVKLSQNWSLQELMGQRLRWLLVATVLVSMIGYLPGRAHATTFDLSTDASQWDEELSELGGVPPAEAATFEIIGGELRVGPWLAGEYAARYAYKSTFNFISGTVKGSYRTENTVDGQTQVAVYYKNASGTILYKDKYQLANADQWTAFSLPIRRAPAGSVKVTLAFGNSMKNDGIVRFKNLQATDTPWSISFPANSPALTRAAKPANLGVSSNWRLEQNGTAWWLVKPNGEPFYSLGLDTPYGDNATQSQAIDTLRSMNFNTIGGWSDILHLAPLNDLKSDPTPAMTTIENGTLQGTFDRVVSALGEAADGHTMPDPFDPRWKTALKAEITAYKNSTNGKSWFIGYFTDNEINHTDLHRKVYSANASQAFKNWLITKYGNDIGALNAAWGRTYASFDSLIAQKPDPAKRSGAMYADFKAFKRVMVQQYVDVVKASFMEVYNNNPPLLFSNRFTTDLQDVYDVLDIYAAAFDGIAYNVYPGGLQVGLPQYALNQIEELHQLTGKPVMIGEWSVPALDSGLYNNPSKLDFSYPENVDTQTDRARQAAYVTAQLYNIPYVVGSHWYIWSDFDNSSRSANRGIFKADGVTPWAELKTALTAANGSIVGTGGGTPGGTTTVQLNPAADAYVRGGSSYQNMNYGADTILNVKDSTDSQYDRRSYLKFDLSGIPATASTSAILKVYVRSMPNGSPVTVRAFDIVDDSWTESGIKWANMPSVGAQLASVNVTAAGAVYSWDVTSFVSSQLAGDKIVSLALLDNAIMNKEVQMDSKEASVKPVLELTY